MKRRKFIALAGTAIVASPVLGNLAFSASNSTDLANYKFPELGYSYNALEPYIDAQTMELHYNKHHRGYYTKFMAAAENTDVLNLPIEDVFKSISKYSSGIRNNGGGYYNHALYWENMTPAKIGINSALKIAIDKEFGSVDSFKEKFGSAAKTHFGSGWAWLSVDKTGKLFVSSTPNQDNPLMDIVKEQGTPLLAIDVWEHAYYLNYQNKRAEYVDNFWNIVNWDVVNKRWLAAKG